MVAEFVEQRVLQIHLPNEIESDEESGRVLEDAVDKELDVLRLSSPGSAVQTTAVPYGHLPTSAPRVLAPSLTIESCMAAEDHGAETCEVPGLDAGQQSHDRG